MYLESVFGETGWVGISLFRVVLPLIPEIRNPCSRNNHCLSVVVSLLRYLGTSCFWYYPFFLPVLSFPGLITHVFVYTVYINKLLFKMESVRTRMTMAPDN